MLHAVLIGLSSLLATLGVAAGPPPQATAAFSRAQAAIAGHDCEAAMRLLDEAIAAAPDYWEAHRAYGECLLKLNKPDEARPHLEEALKRSPGDPSTRAMLARVRDLQKAEAEQMAQAIQARDRLSRVQPEKAARPPRPLGDYARARPSPAAPSAPLDPLRARVTSIFRPRMVAVAPAYRSLVTADRRYRAACRPNATAPTAEGAGGIRTRDGRYEIGRYTSEAAWRGRFAGATLERNDETPACRALASEVRALSSRMAAAMDGVDAALASPPPVDEALREEVFARLASEVW
jgi:tetratricopeptide (TPR) repeat protein